MKTKYLLAALVITIVVGVAGFFAGMKYQQGKQPSFAGRQFGQGQGLGSARRSSGGGGPVNGSIISNTDKSITVKLADGSSKIILFSNSTTINKANQATPADLAVGQTVAVFGTTNSDGSVTAQTIQLNPITRP